MPLGPDKALIFRITHRDNLPWICERGLCAQNSKSLDPNFRNIGHPDLIQKRAHRIVKIDPGGTLGDYVPFYFTPFLLTNMHIRDGGIFQRLGRFE